MAQKILFLLTLLLLTNSINAQSNDPDVLKKLINKDWALIIKNKETVPEKWGDIFVNKFSSNYYIYSKYADDINYEDSPSEKWYYQDGYLTVTTKEETVDIKITYLDSTKLSLEYLDPLDGFISYTYYDFRWLKKEDNTLAEEALKTNTKVLYDNYLKKFPYGKYAELISSKSKALEEETMKKAASAEWQSVKNSTDEATLIAFIDKYEDTDYADQAYDILEKVVWQRTLKENTIAAYEKFISDYGNNDNYLKEAKERLYYLGIEKANTITGYENYVKDYPKGIFYSKAIEIIQSSYIRFANGYKKEFSDNMSSTNVKFTDAEKYYKLYIEKFPAGSKISTVKDSLADLYFDKAMYESQFSKSKSSLLLAQEMFNKCLAVKANATNTSFVSGKLSYLDKKIKVLSRDDRSFFAWHADGQAPLGFAFGNINNKNLGYYMAYKMNPSLFTSGTYYTWDGVTYTGNVYTDLRPTGENRVGVMSMSMGPTLKIAWPIWLYAGIGYRYSKHMDQIYEYNALGEFVDSEWVKNTAKSKDGIELSLGAILDFDGFNINIGYSKISFDKNFLSFGVGFSWDR